MLALWVATALVYPKLHKFAVWLVDKVVLRRANYAVLRSEIAGYIEQTRIDRGNPATMFAVRSPWR